MRLGAIVIDSNDIEKLASFYEALLGWTKNQQIHDGEKCIVLSKDDYSETPLVFQEDPDYVAPKWPTTKEEQQQMIHLDFYVSIDEYETKVEHAVKCGAKISEEQFTDKWKVMLDPSGHPFCIIPIPKDIYEQRYNKGIELSHVNIYEFIKKLNHEEITHMISKAKTQEEAKFYAKITDYLLQENQKRLIKEGVF